MDDFSLHTDHIELERELLRFGLTRQEAKVYQCLLLFGSLLASSIARQVKMNRSSVYGVLSSLRKLGLISEYDRNGVTYFSASCMSRFEDLFEERIIQQRVLQKRLVHLFSRFSKVKDAPHDRGKIHCFDGFEGVKSVYFDVIKHQLPVYAFVSSQFPSAEWEFFYSQVFEKQRVAHSVIFYSIVSGNDDCFVKINSDRIISATNSGCAVSECHLFIYGQRVAFIPFYPVEPSAFIFDDRKFTSIILSLFRVLWMKCGGDDVFLDHTPE